LKILFLDTEPIRRGAQIFISELSSFLREKGTDCRTIYLYKTEELSDQQLTLSSEDRNLRGERQNFFEKIPGINPAIFKRLIREIDSFSPWVIVANGSRTLKYAAAARQFYKKDSLWVARWIDDAAFWNPGQISKWIYKELIISKFDAVVAVSQSSLDSVIMHYEFNNPTKVIHRVFDSKKFEQAPDRKEARGRLGLNESDEVLLFLGNLTSQKRPDRFIQIVQELAKTRPNLRGLIVGDGEMRKELESQVAGIKYQENRDKKQEARGEREEPRAERQEARSVKLEEYQVTSIEYQETNDEGLETRDKIQEARGEREDARSEEQHESQVASIKNQENRDKEQEARTESQMPRAGKKEARGERDARNESCGTTSGAFISFMGYQADVAPYLAAADLLILTSDTEGLPGVVLEAAYFSVPTVASDVGGIRECLIDRETGVLVPDREVSAFCQAISHLLDDHDHRMKMGKAARIFIEENFRMDVAGQQYLDFFNELRRLQRSRFDQIEKS
jgi:glycosyltransferase involved in cell wall biosynthesis